MFVQAAARHQCTYLINIHTKEFIEQGGDRTWLKGLEHIPPKLRAIYEINKILAHRPWLLNIEHIEVRNSLQFYLKFKFNMNLCWQCLTKGRYSWSLSEVVHAIVLLSHFHSLSSFVFSCGHIQELDPSTSQLQSVKPTGRRIVHKPGCNCPDRDKPGKHKDAFY